MKGNIFLIQGNGQLVEMEEQAYDSEDLLQRLLAEYPNLLAGSQIDKDAPRRWLLISREAPIPSSESGSGRWSVDHLFLDQDAILTLSTVSLGMTRHRGSAEAFPLFSPDAIRMGRKRRTFSRAARGSESRDLPSRSSR